MKSFSIENSHVPGLSVKELESIDAVCVQFERQLKLSESPDIAVHLVGYNDPVRDALLVELIKLEVDYQRRRGLQPSREEYDSRFPRETPAIDAAFEKTAGPNYAACDATTSVERDQSLPFDELDLSSQFTLERFHARGGLGEVYVAHDRRLGRPVAIKLPRDRDPNSPDHQRLGREAAITSRLKHPGIIPVYATGEQPDSLPFYIMPFIEGQTFRDAIRDFHSAPIESGDNKFASREFRRLLQRLLAVCNTVAYAHRQGVIHRDIKPANIMLGEFGETFLLDWGLAKRCNESGTAADPPVRSDSNLPPTALESGSESPAETQPGQPIGTPEFASPEQMMGRVDEHNQRSDVYSLGATLYYLLLGKAGVEFAELTNLADASALRKMASPRSRNPSVPADLNAICLKAMSFESVDRYATATELAEDLDRFLADERVSVSRPGWTTNIRRLIRRKPRLASSLATAIVLALLGTSLGAWMLDQKADELSLALTAQQQTSLELQQSKESAEGYANDAMDALKTLSGRVVKQWFTEQKSFSQTERDFLQQIVDQYQDLARSQPDEWFSRTIQAEAFHAVAQIQMLLGQNDEAMQSIERVIELLTPMPADAGRTPRVLNATIIVDKGNMLFASGDSEAGTMTMQLGIEMLAALAKDFPEEDRFRETLAAAFNKLGTTYVTARQWDLAIEQFRKARSITAELVERQPDNIVFLSSHQNKTSNLGVALAHSGDHEAAMIEYQAANAMYDELFELDAIYSDVYRASGVPVHYIAVANSLIQLDRKDEADEYLERAVQVAQQMTSTYPMFPGGFVSLARAHHGLAGELLAKREFAAAVSESTLAAEAAGQAVKLSPQQQNQNVRRLIQKRLASALEKNGDRPGANAAFLKLIQFNEEQLAHTDTPENAMRTGGEYLRLVKFQKHIKQNADAITSLERAIELFESIPESSKLFQTAQSFLRKSKSDLVELVAAQPPPDSD